MQTLNQDIKEKTFKRVYLLFGDEPFLVNSYKKRLREAIAGDDTMNYNYFEGKGPDVKEIISLADTMPFFAERRLVMVDGSGFFKNSAPEELVNYIAEIPESTCMVFVESEVDKRNKLYKKVKDNGYAAELKKQDADQLMRWAAGILAKDGKKITRQVMEYFMERTGDDMENIRMELEKLICYTMGREVITKEDVEAVGTVHVTNRIFEMVTAIVAGNTRKAMDLYEDLLTLKEPPMRIMFLIAKQFNQLLQVKELAGKGAQKGEIASKVKVSPFVAGKLIAQARAFSREQILSYVEFCVESEEAVKTGRLSDRLAVELLIARKYR
ncbi:MAG: DNA polymerase III subunit delta [Candidatus Copromonas sp.]|nr:DNA polymerase III subunit delta [Candidatus Copromonas sp.]